MFQEKTSGTFFFFFNKQLFYQHKNQYVYIVHKKINFKIFLSHKCKIIQQFFL